ncbi:polysaccharide pyruvyl transferase family protein [Clostridium perfringens]|uniref:polysaccharide pyruvyl transferase family protein n=1 Tax=Clostridium perfringens TaxID=1502 RepID=UPI0024BD0143|nr:polysaccharide pyruvyl transferase family protein [Clostridium perfringens]MDU7548964.1 polysaccharide pyruvyl transferase family protein [Clostridium perfringens]
MKVGIITYHCAHNCGAMLQSYALQETIKKLGYNVEIVDYRPEIITQGYKIRLRRSNNLIKDSIYLLLTYHKQKKKYKLFEEFESNYFCLSEKKYICDIDFLEFKSKYNILVCGSDQIWNMDLNGESPVYFLDFDDFYGKRISYAASIGTSKIKDKYIEKTKFYIKNFDFISLREKQGKKEIQKLTTKNVEQVLDPVFLLEENEWNNLENKEMGINYDYAIIYVMEENPLIQEISKFISEELKLKVICISNSIRNKKYIYKNLSNVGPKEFVSLIKNAKLVCTNSFHGTCLSIIFRKQFLSIAHSTLNSRIESVLDIFNLKEHCINTIPSSKIEFEKIINSNLDKVELILSQERKKSLEFLEDSLKN